MQEKFAIFSDIDGTVYSFNQQKMHPDTIKDIKEAKAKKIEFVLATGNPYQDQVKWLVKELGVVDIVICSNGAFAYDIKNDKQIFSLDIDAVEAEKLLQIALKHKLGANWWDAETLYTSQYTSKDVLDIITAVCLRGKKPKHDDQIRGAIQKIEFIGDEKLISLAMEELKDFDLQIARIHGGHIEITKKGASKGEALVKVAEYINVPLENTMSIGDSSNDWTMFETAAFSYAMDNGSKETKAKAKYYTSSVEQNGLGEAIIDFMFRNRLTDNFENNREIPNKKS